MSKCGCGKELSDEQKKILEAMSRIGESCASRDIAEATGLDGKAVSCRLSGLKKKGYIDSPVRCRYGITAEGRKYLGI